MKNIDKSLLSKFLCANLSMFLFSFVGCGAPKLITGPSIATSADTPSLVKNRKRPALLTRAPRYCQTRVAPEHARLLEQFVVETYNLSMKDIPGFKPAVARDGTQPSISFANPAKPRFYYPQKRVELHATLCNRPNSADFLFKCMDNSLLNIVAAQAAAKDPQSEYMRFYSKHGALGTFRFEKSRNWGQAFVGLPLKPKALEDKSGAIISGDLHVSLAKIYTSKKDQPESLASKALKAQLSKALTDRFAQLQALLPDGIRLEGVFCVN